MAEEMRDIQVTDPIVDSVIDQFVQRATFGRKKYGVGMERNDLKLTEWVEHAKQEMMDALLYLEKIKSMVDDKE
jgi:hypothetical protein